MVLSFPLESLKEEHDMTWEIIKKETLDDFQPFFPLF